MIASPLFAGGINPALFLEHENPPGVLGGFFFYSRVFRKLGVWLLLGFKNNSGQHFKNSLPCPGSCRPPTQLFFILAGANVTIFLAVALFLQDALNRYQEKLLG
jgi:hypothetical protein